jgi:ABC-type branched-subunit amino acid transport system substrate-binding protein
VSHSRLILGLGLLLSTLLVGCPKHTEPNSQVPRLVTQAQALADTDRMGAIRLLEDYLSSPSKDATVTPWALLWAGEQRRLGGDPAEARRWFERIAAEHPTHRLKGPAQLGMAVVDAGDSLSGNGIATLQLIAPTDVPDSLNADRYRILARVSADEGSPRHKVLAHVRKAVEYSRGDATVHARVMADLSDLISEAEEIESSTGPSAEMKALQGARDALNDGDFDSALSKAEQFMLTWPASAHQLEAGYIKRRAKAHNPSTPGKVGILLPLSGDWAPAANRVKQAIEMSNRIHGDALTLVFVDTKGEEEEAIAQAAKLVIEEGCVALMGPMLRANGEAVAEHAQALRTPMIALTHSGDPAAVGDFVYRAFLPMSQQIDALLDHAINQAGHQRFAIIHPRNGYGNQARDLFGTGVERRGGRIITVLGYETDTRDFQAMVKELSVTTLDDQAKAELEELRARAVRRGRDPGKVKVPNNLTFDAIFIPDGNERLVLIASALTYQGFPVGRFGRGKTDRPVQLLGLNAWNDPSLAQQGGRYVWDSVFVDAFHTSSYAPPIQQFATLFEDEFGQAPGVTDALAWDAVRLLSPAVQKGRASRQAIQTALSKVRITGPVAGGTHFLPSGEVERELMILTVKPAGIEQWMMSNSDEGQ